MENMAILEHADFVRLGNQSIKIKQLMGDGSWRIFSEIAHAVGLPVNSAPSISAHLRKFRKKGYILEKRLRNGIRGLYEYRLSPGRLL